MKLKRIKLKSTIKFDKRIAMRFSKPEYYAVYGDDVRNLPKRDSEKGKYSTIKQERVTRMLANYKKLLEVKANGIFHVLKGIYNTNVKAISTGSPLPVHTNVMSLVASVPVLIVSYNRIRGNKGATTLGAMLSHHRVRGMNPTQRRFLSASWRLPDGISYSTFAAASSLLKEGRYPWGASRRIDIGKPGQPDKKRPITIPPFMDRVIQTAILYVLESIYEPTFEVTNCSFGFRKGKGVHDAIYSIIRQENKGMFTAIEGDVRKAYDNVDRAKLVQILSKRINDRKFLQLVQKRLDYQVYDQVQRVYLEEDRGLPQGGIDSPYLWNIYMHEFDLFISERMTSLLDTLNAKARPNLASRSKTLTKEQAANIAEKKALTQLVGPLQRYNTKAKLKAIPTRIQTIRYRLRPYFEDPANLTEDGTQLLPSVKYSVIKQIKRLRHRGLNLPASNPNKRVLRYHYVRYADDWILLGNFSKLLAEKIRGEIASWLKLNLSAELAEEKTLITDFSDPRTPARFLGFEIRSRKTRTLAYKKTGNSDRPVLTRVAGSEVKAYPDKQRLISRLHMKGFCDKLGNPRPQSWMSTLETFALISRFNSVLLGLGNFYYGFVPKSSLNRWIYIIRFSLFKTLAQKYNTNIKGIFTRFGTRTDKGNSVSYYVKNIFKERGTETEMLKTWDLLTEIEIQGRCLANDRYTQVKAVFNKVHYDKRIPEFVGNPEGRRDPSIKDDDWTNNLMWVNLRTQASLDAPCCRCGSTQNVQMHHIKHIRKIIYSQIPGDKPWLNIMALRNRKQIPVCRECHMNVIHRGTYKGDNLRSLVYPGVHTKKGFDNRLINIENYVTRSKKEFYARSLEEKGWKYLP